MSATKTLLLIDDDQDLRETLKDQFELYDAFTILQAENAADGIIKAKEEVDSGRFGEILWMRGRYGKSVPENFYQDWRSQKELAGGGIFLDQGIHMLDLFMHLVGKLDEVKSFVSI